MSFKIKTAVCMLTFLGCSLLNPSKDNSDKNKQIALAALALSASKTVCTSSSSTGSTVTNSTATLNSATGCVTGVNTCMDSALPSWIRDNFKCSVAYLDGTNIVFKSQNLPNHKSYYWGSSSALFDSATAGNPSTIASQKMVYKIPGNAAKGSGTDSTQAGQVSIGITVNGLAIFNNAAAPPDVLKNEAVSFDSYSGHPESTGTYHHHAAVPMVCDGTTLVSNSASCNNSKLIGIALDGYAIYGQKCDKGTSSTSDDTAPTDLDSLHGHTAVTTHFSTATYHYHYAYDATATIYTLMGSYFYGKQGSVSN